MINNTEIQPVIKAFLNDDKDSSSFKRISAIFVTKIKTALNYKSAYFTVLLMNFIYVLMFYYFGKLIPNISINDITVSYFEYAIIGLSLQMVIGTSLTSTSNNLYSEIIMGTWSSLLPYFNLTEYAIGTSLAGISLASVSIVVAMVTARLLTGMMIRINLTTTLIILITLFLIIFSYISLSCLFSAYTIWYKRNSGILNMLYRLSTTFSGITYPIALLTKFPVAFFISRIIPLTYGLENLQIVIHGSNNFIVIAINSAILLGITILVMALSIYLVKLAIKKTKQNGTIGSY